MGNKGDLMQIYFRGFQDFRDEFKKLNARPVRSTWIKKHKIKTGPKIEFN